MNKILIAGHPASGYQEVHGVLQLCGMNKPLPSRRDGLLPQEITSTLCKVYQRQQVDRVTNEDDIEQLQVTSVWHGMALDLMLGNLEQELWGWADPQAIYALDYWKQLDDKLTFVLVYDEPQLALMNAATKLQTLSTPELEHQLNNWMAYNGALLRFFLRNTERCLLVHSQQVSRDSEDYLQKLQPLLSAQLSSLPENGMPVTESTLLSGKPNKTMMPAQKLTEIASLAGLGTKEPQKILQGSAVERYLLDQVLAEYPACLQLYAELQSAASLPQQESAWEGVNPAKAWETLVQQRTLTIDLASGLHEAYQGMSLNLEQAVAEQTRESELLLSQLHQVQEKLEHHYLQKQELEQRSTEQSREIQRQSELTRQKEADKFALNKALIEAQKQLEITQFAGDQKLSEQDVQLKALNDENNLLLTQLHQVQDELERYYLDNQLLKKQLPIPMYGAAQRVKQELGYRLGSVMIKRSRSLTGWLGMPWALVAERQDWRQHCATVPQNALPAIETYRDAHEAEQVKNHLSYRLGQALIRNGQSPLGWVKLPFALSSEVRQFRLQRKEG